MVALIDYTEPKDWSWVDDSNLC